MISKEYETSYSISDFKSVPFNQVQYTSKYSISKDYITKIVFGISSTVQPSPLSSKSIKHR